MSEVVTGNRNSLFSIEDGVEIEMKQISDHDLRQLHQMEQVIDAFLVNQARLKEVVATLSFLLSHLDEILGSWKDAFQNDWIRLEMINAEVDEQERKITAEEQQYVLDKARNLKALIRQVINE